MCVDRALLIAQRLPGRELVLWILSFPLILSSVALVVALLMQNLKDVMGVFERAPYIAEFTPVDDVTFPIAFIGLHAKPDAMQTDAELTELSAVRMSVASHFMHDNIVLFGDFNAGTDNHQQVLSMRT